MNALLNKIDFDLLKHQMANAPAFPHYHINNFLDESFANEIHDSFPSYEEARKIGHEFSAVNEKRKTQITDSTKFPSAFLRLSQLLASDSFVKAISHMSGIQNLVPDPKLTGGGIHETNHCGHLDVHFDFNFDEERGLHRRLNLLVYFNKDWKEEYGGYLDLWDKDVKNCVGKFAPTFNCVAGFATGNSSWHGVTPVTCPTNVMRKSFAVYYYSKEPPTDWDGVKHSTIFRARPDEYWKGNVSMPAENLVRATRKVIKSVKKSVKETLMPYSKV